MTLKKSEQLNRIPQRIAYAVDWRDGDGEEQVGDPTFCFRGTNIYHLRRVFDFLVPANGRGIARSYTADYEHDVAYRFGHGYDRHYVTLHGFNSHFCSIDDACLLIESLLLRDIAQRVERMPLHQFLNV